MTFFEQLMDDGIEPDLAILTAIVGPEEAQRRLDEWRALAARRAAAQRQAATS